MRLLLRDRITASAIALLISYLLLLQGLLGAIANGAMAAVPGDMQVICTSSGYESSASSRVGAVPFGKSAPECPCPLLCGLASTAQNSILPASPDILALFEESSRDRRALAVDPWLSTLRGLIGEPRAPPAVL